MPRAGRIPPLTMPKVWMAYFFDVSGGLSKVEKIPVGLTSFNHYRPRQKEAIALLTEQSRSKDELSELMGLKKSNLQKVLQTLISTGEIIPNLKTGKYEIHSSKP